MLPAIPEDTAESVVTAAEAENDVADIAIVPIEVIVIAERMPAMIFVLMFLFFVMFSPLRFCVFSCRCLDYGYNIP